MIVGPTHNINITVYHELADSIRGQPCEIQFW